MEKWVGKTAVVTGASSGIGKAIFKDFARHGINVIGLARQAKKIEAVIEELGEPKGKAYAYQCDVSNSKSVKEAFNWIESNFVVVNILINNAGISRNTRVLDDLEESFQDFNEILDTNVRGLAQCSREAYRLMKKSNDYGLIININSVLGHSIPFVRFSMSSYPASKFAVTALTETMRQELVVANDCKIRVTSLSPGYVKTEILSSGGFDILGAKPGAMKNLASMPSLKPEDIAFSVCFILSCPVTVNISELTIKPIRKIP